MFIEQPPNVRAPAGFIEPKANDTEPGPLETTVQLQIWLRKQAEQNVLNTPFHVCIEKCIPGPGRKDALVHLLTEQVAMVLRILNASFYDDPKSPMPPQLVRKIKVVLISLIQLFPLSSSLLELWRSVLSVKMQTPSGLCSHSSLG